jgi:hypothetical protein
MVIPSYESNCIISKKASVLLVFYQPYLINQKTTSRRRIKPLRAIDHDFISRSEALDCTRPLLRVEVFRWFCIGEEEGRDIDIDIDGIFGEFF